MAREISMTGHVEANPIRDLAELEQLYRTAPVGLCVLDRDLRFVRINNVLAEFNGGSVDEILGRTLEEVRPELDPSTVPALRHVLETGEPVRDVEAEGMSLGDPPEHRHWLVSYYPLRDGDVIVGVSVIAQDITATKRGRSALRRSQEELRRLAARLISDQEVAGESLARELHDDVSQRLAAMTLDIGQLEATLGGTGAVVEELRRLKAQIAVLSSDIHRISRRLHPSILDDLGLVAAIEAEASSFLDREGVPVRVQATTIPTALSDQMALCLYRIVQESLRNVAKHAAASEVRVILACEPGEVRLLIADDGLGFDPDVAKERAGLGLISMTERARQVGGEVHLESNGRGTQVSVLIPLGGER